METCNVESKRLNWTSLKQRKRLPPEGNVTMTINVRYTLIWKTKEAPRSGKLPNVPTKLYLSGPGNLNSPPDKRHSNDVTVRDAVIGNNFVTPAIVQAQSRSFTFIDGITPLLYSYKGNIMCAFGNHTLKIIRYHRIRIVAPWNYNF